MKLCPHCSSSLEEDAVKCRQCGKWVVGKNQKQTTRKPRILTGPRLKVLAALAILAWMVGSMPDGAMDPREVLASNPSPAMALERIRSDLEGLLALEADHYRLHGAYSGSPATLGFQASEGVKISLIATPSGWAASGTFEVFSSEMGCGVYGGLAGPPRSPISPTEPGSVVCTEEPQ